MRQIPVQQQLILEYPKAQTGGKGRIPAVQVHIAQRALQISI